MSMKRLLLFTLLLSMYLASAQSNLNFYTETATFAEHSVYQDAVLYLHVPSQRILQVGNTASNSPSNVYSGSLLYKNTFGTALKTISLKYIVCPIGQPVNVSDPGYIAATVPVSGVELTIPGLSIQPGDKLVLVETFELFSCPDGVNNKSTTELKNSSGALIANSHNSGTSIINQSIQKAPDPSFVYTTLLPRNKKTCLYNGSNYTEASEEVMFSIRKSADDATINNPLMIFLTGSPEFIIDRTTIQVVKRNIQTQIGTTYTLDQIISQYDGNVYNQVPPQFVKDIAFMDGNDFWSSVHTRFPVTDSVFTRDEEIIVSYKVVRLCNNQSGTHNSITENFRIQASNGCNQTILRDHSHGMPGTITMSGYYVDRPISMEAAASVNFGAGNITVPDLDKASQANLLNKVDPPYEFFGLGYNSSEDIAFDQGFLMNMDNAELVVVLSTQPGIRYSAFNEATLATIAGIYPYSQAGLTPDPEESVPTMRLVNENENTVWLPLNPDGNNSGYSFSPGDNGLGTNGKPYNRNNTFVFKLNTFPGAAAILAASYANPSDRIRALKTALRDYINAATLDYTLESECPAVDGPNYDLDFYLNIDNTCTTCLLPLFSNNKATLVNCPGCLIAGGAGKSFSIKRSTYGFIDADNNGKAETNILANATTPGVRKNYGIAGDEFNVKVNYNMTDGNQYCETQQAPGDDDFVLKNTYLQVNFPVQYGDMLDVPATLSNGTNNMLHFKITGTSGYEVEYNETLQQAYVDGYIVATRNADMAFESLILHINIDDIKTDPRINILNGNSNFNAASQFYSGDFIFVSFDVAIVKNNTALLQTIPVNEAIFSAQPTFSVNQVLNKTTGIFNANSNISDLACSDNPPPYIEDAALDLLNDNTRFFCEGTEAAIYLIGIYSNLTNIKDIDLTPDCSQHIGNSFYSNIGYIASPGQDNFSNLFRNELRTPPLTNNLIFTVPSGFVPSVTTHYFRSALENTKIVYGFQRVADRKYSTGDPYLEKINSFSQNGLGYDTYRFNLTYNQTEANSANISYETISDPDFHINDETSVFDFDISLIPVCSELSESTPYPLVPPTSSTPSDYDWIFNIAEFPDFLTYPASNQTLTLRDEYSGIIFNKPQADIDIVGSGSALNINLSTVEFEETFQIVNHSSFTLTNRFVAFDETFLNDNFDAFEIISTTGITPITSNNIRYYVLNESQSTFSVKGTIKANRFVCDGGNGLSTLPFYYGWNCTNNWEEIILSELCQHENTAFQFVITAATVQASSIVSDTDFNNANCGKMKFSETYTALGGSIKDVVVTLTTPSGFSFDYATASNLEILFGTETLSSTEYSITPVTGTTFDVHVPLNDRLFIGSGIADDPSDANSLTFTFILDAPSTCFDFNPSAQVLLDFTAQRFCGSTFAPPVSRSITNTYKACQGPEVTISGTSTICQNNTLELQANITSLFAPNIVVWTYQNPSGTTTIQTTNGSSNTNVLNAYVPSSSGTIEVSVTDNNGCVDMYSVPVVVNTLPVVSAGSDAEICQGTSNVLTASGAGTYVWSNGSTNVYIWVSPSSTSTYSVTGTDANGCSATDAVTVTVNQTPSVTLPALGYVCPEENGTPNCITINPSVTGGTPGNDPLYTYQWSNGSTSSTIEVCPSVNSSYSVIVADSKGCTTTVNAAVDVSPQYQLEVNPDTWVCGNPDKTVCVKLKAMHNVENGIIGMDYALNYDVNLFQLKSTYNSIRNSFINSQNVVVKGNNPDASITPDVYLFDDKTNGIVHLSIYYNSTSPANTYFTGSGQVAEVCFTITGSPAAGMDYLFTPWELEEAYTLSEKEPCWEGDHFHVGYATTTKGELIYANNINLTPGYTKKILSYNGDPNVRNITNIFGTDDACGNISAQSVVPDNNAIFLYDKSNGNKMKIYRDVKNNLLFSQMRYLNGYDSYIMGYITTMTPPQNNPIMPGYTHNFRANHPTPYQMIAADVNMNDHVRANDITLLQERIVKKIDEFPQVWNNTTGELSLDWRFIDNSTLSGPNYTRSNGFPMTGGTNGGYWRDDVPDAPFCLPTLNQCLNEAPASYYGILLGDVYDGGSGAVYPQKGDPRFRTTTPDPYITIDFKNSTPVNEHTLKVPVYYATSEGDTLHSMDFAVDFDETKIVMREAISSAIFSDLEINMMSNSKDASEFLLTSYSMKTLPLNGLAYYVLVDKLTEDAITSKNFGTKMAILNGIEVPLRIETDEVNSTETYNSLSVSPNPALDHTVIEYSLDKNIQHAKLAIMNTLSQKIAEYECSGTGYIELNTNDMAAGIYTCVIYSDNADILLKRFEVIK